MIEDTYAIKTNIKRGKEIFENIPNHIKPCWAGLILSQFSNHIKEIPTPVLELFGIVDNKDRWPEANGIVRKIKQFLINNKNFKPDTYLLLAEKIAAVTFDFTDHKSKVNDENGWNIPKLALQTAGKLESPWLEEEVVASILIIEHSKKYKINLNSVKDLLLYKKIDDILWFDWDPIEVNDIAPRDEYQSYVPKIYTLKKSGSNIDEITKHLFNFETEFMRVSRKYDKCVMIADKIFSA